MNGFFDCEITTKYTIFNDTTDVNLKFIIEEGDPYFFRSYNRNGLESVYYRFVDDVVKEYIIDSTLRYSEQLVLADMNHIRRYMRDRGYMFFGYGNPDIYIDTSLKKIDVDLFFIPGKPYFIDSIFVVKDGPGSELVENELIREVAGIEPGDDYSDYDLTSAQIRLYRTNLFTSAQIEPNSADTSGKYVPLTISTTVGLMHEFTPEIILNNEDNTLNLGFSLGFSKKNFFGDARRLTLQGSMAAQNIFEFISNPSLSDTSVFGYGDVRLILEQPFLFGNLINTKVESYATLQKRRENYNTSLFGARLGLDFYLPQKVYLTGFLTYMNWEHEKTKLFDEYLERLYRTTLENNTDLTPEEINDSVRVLLDDISEDNKNYSTNNTVIGFDLSANKTNNILFPTRGYRISTILENGNGIPFVFSKISNSQFDKPLYYKVVFNTSYFPNIYEDINSAFGIKLNIGTIQAYRGDKFNIPLNQRFAAGGSNSVRGWGNRELVPLKASIPEDATIDELESIFIRNTLPGGFFWLEGTFETRNRLLSELGSALFLDYGNVWNGTKDFRFDEVAIAAGIGLRYYTPFAPFRIDLGFKVYDPKHPEKWITKRKVWQEGTFQIHLGVGEAF